MKILEPNFYNTLGKLKEDKKNWKEHVYRMYDGRIPKVKRSVSVEIEIRQIT